MTQHLALIEENFQQIVAQKSAFAEALSARLVAEFPQVQSLCAHTDLCLEQHRLMAFLDMIVNRLRHPEQRTEPLRELGLRHEGYHIRHEHYVMVGSALLGTLADFLGEAWSPQVCKAWIEAYGAVASLMVASNAPPLEV